MTERACCGCCWASSFFFQKSCDAEKMHDGITSLPACLRQPCMHASGLFSLTVFEHDATLKIQPAVVMWPSLMSLSCLDYFMGSDQLTTCPALITVSFTCARCAYACLPVVILLTTSSIQTCWLIFLIRPAAGKRDSSHISVPSATAKPRACDEELISECERRLRPLRGHVFVQKSSESFGLARKDEHMEKIFPTIRRSRVPSVNNFAKHYCQAQTPKDTHVRDARAVK